MWKPGQLVTIGGSVYRVSRKARNCVGCDAHSNGCDSSCIIFLKNYSVPCYRQLPAGYALKRIGVKYVDLGLPSGTLWAECNVGAKTGGSNGDYLTFKDAQKYNLPTEEQFKELIKECEWRWNGYGCWVFGKNGNRIFLPAAGGRDSVGIYGVGTHGLYWLSTINYIYARRLYFNPVEQYVNDIIRYLNVGFSVRPVLNKT